MDLWAPTPTTTDPGLRDEDRKEDPLGWRKHHLGLQALHQRQGDLPRDKL